MHARQSDEVFEEVVKQQLNGRVIVQFIYFVQIWGATAESKLQQPST